MLTGHKVIGGTQSFPDFARLHRPPKQKMGTVLECLLHVFAVRRNCENDGIFVAATLSHIRENWLCVGNRIKVHKYTFVFCPVQLIRDLINIHAGARFDSKLSQRIRNYRH